MKMLYPYWQREALRYKQLYNIDTLAASFVELDMAKRKLFRELNFTITSIISTFVR